MTGHRRARRGMRDMWTSTLMVLLSAALAACGTDATDNGEADADTADTSDTDGTDGTDEAADRAGPVPGSVLTVGFGAPPQTLDWHLHGDPTAELVLWSINEALVETTADGQVLPRLAATVPTVDPDRPDRWRVELREGISFTNGEAFDAAAVKANVDRVSDPDFETITSGFELLAGAEVVSDHVVEIITDGPDPFFLSRLSELRMLPPEAQNQPVYAENPVGTGPYVFEEWDRGANVIRLRVNTDYWGDAPTVERVEIRIVPDESTRVSALRTGEIDMAPVAPDQVAQVPAVIRGGAAAESGATRINLAQPPYDDVRFRRALNYAIDKDAINDAIFGGQYEVSACQAVPPGAFGYNPDLDPYPYDPERARTLLADVDLPDGFAVQFEGTSGFWVRDREVQEAVASYWREVGLDVDMTVNPEDAYLDKLLAGDDSPGVVYMELDHRYFHGARIVDRQFARDGAIATIGDELPQVDGLLEATQTFDEQASLDAFAELFRIGCDGAVAVFTIDRYDLWGSTERVEYEPQGTGIHRLDFHRVRLTE